jgi:hypothetical protein
MRYIVLTDIHGNLEALDACLADARVHTFDETLVLGDLVGYGPDPNAVVERVQALTPVGLVRGNHDKVACGLEQAEGFNSVAKSAAKWTLDVLTPAHRDWLADLPEGPIDVDDTVQICHGSPFDEDAYIFDELDAAALPVWPHSLPGHLRALRRFVPERRLGGLAADGGADAQRLQVPAESRVGRSAARRRSARRLRDRRHGEAPRRTVSGALCRRGNAGKDSQGGTRRRACAAARRRSVGNERDLTTK